MTTLVVTELRTSLTQSYSFDLNERAHIGSVSPYIYIHNAPAGNFSLTLSQNSNVVISKSFDCNDLLSELGTVDDFAHGFFPFIDDSLMIVENGDFTVTLTAVSGYSYNESSFIGWVRQHEDIQNAMNYTPLNDSENPLAARIKIYKQGIL